METEVKKPVRRKIDFSAFANVAVFFTLEVLAFIAFSLGTSYILFSILSVVLLVCLVLVTFKQIKTDGLASFAFFLVPLFVFGLLCILSNFTLIPSFVLYNQTFFIPIAMTCFAACGYFVSSLKIFSISKALLVIYSALAILVFINLIATMVEFMPFYTLLHRNKYIYYDGDISSVPVSGMAFALLGFSISEVSVEYFSLFPSLLITAIIPLFFIKFKQNKTTFLLYLGYALLGFFSLLTTVSKMTIITDVLLFAIVLLVLLFAKFQWKGKVLKKVSLVFAGLFVVGFLVLFLNAQEGGVGIIQSLQNFIAGNPLLNRLFNTNGLAIKYNQILNRVTTTNGNGEFVYLFGFFPTSEIIPTNSWLFDILMTTGLFGLLFFIAVIIFGLVQLMKYYRSSADHLKDKAMVVAFILCFFAYGLLNYDMTPFIFSSDLSPIYLSGPFLVCLFLFSYAFYKVVNKPKETKLIANDSQKSEKKEGEIIDEKISL